MERKPFPWVFEDIVVASETRRVAGYGSAFVPAHCKRLSSTLRVAFGEGDAPMRVPVRITVERGRIVIERTGERR